MNCKHCGKELIEGFNHSEDSYEHDICDNCMNLYYGYCDNCDKLFEYHDKMLDWNKAGVICKTCHNEFSEFLNSYTYEL